jgi:hypothetical protein
MSPDDRAVAELSGTADPADAAAARDLAEAERAVVQRTATADQVTGVAAVASIRRPEDRVRAWRAATRR